MYDVQVLRAACCIAGLDKDISERERPFLEHLARKAGVGQASFQAMLDLAVEKPDFYEKQLEMIRDDPERIIRTLFMVAAADGRFESRERIILHFFAKKVGLTDEQYDAIIKDARTSITQPEGDNG